MSVVSIVEPVARCLVVETVDSTGLSYQAVAVLGYQTTTQLSSSPYILQGRDK